MGVERLSDAFKDDARKEIPAKSFFPDSDRENEFKLPTIDLPSEQVEINNSDELYPDSSRDFSDGPQWNEEDVDNLKYNTDELSYDSERCDDIEALDNENASETSKSDVEEPSENKETDSPEYNEDGTRELTKEEWQELKEKLGWSDDKLKKCTIDKDGVIHYKTDRCDLEGKTSENGVPYVRRTIEINGVKIEGVFPKFDSIFDTQLSPENYKSKAYAKECNAKLKEAIQNDPELRAKFTPEQIKDIEEGRTPTGYVWHHNEEPGKMQLVKREDHDRTMGGAAHTGGNSLWGADSVDNGKKGESF